MKRDLTRLRIRNLVQQTMTHHKTSAEVKAKECLLEALALAEPGGYLRTFLDVGGEMQVLLSRVRLPGSGIGREYFVSLIEAFGRGADEGGEGSRGTAPLLELIEPLSERELEVLKLITDGYSNRQIAGKLFINLGTVKAHTASIYRKLDVRSRTQAVAYARELQLI